MLRFLPSLATVCTGFSHVEVKPRNFMANSGASDVVSLDSEIETPLLFLDTVHGAVDYKGRPVIRSKSGYWRSAWFIIGFPTLNHLIYIYFSSVFLFWFNFILWKAWRWQRDAHTME